MKSYLNTPQMRDFLAAHKVQATGGGEMMRDPESGAWTTTTAYQNKVDQMKSQGLNPDGSPIRPEFSGITNEDGTLMDKYKLAGEADITVDQRAMDEIRNRGLEKGPSAWAKMMTDRQALEQTNAMDESRNQAAGAQAQTLSNLMMRGGLQGGSRERIARSTLRDQLMGSQQINRQGMLDRANIGLQDESMKQDFLKTTANLDFQKANLDNTNRQYRTDISKTNLMNTLGGLEAKNNHNMGVYSEGMKKWAANKQADAQSRASGGGGCCFIFLEARYGTGAMDSVVRRYRDEHMTDQNRRGYYKLSEVLVPLMRKSNLVKGLVRVTMTDPLVSFGKWHYTKKGFGWIFKPVKDFWMKTFEYLGQDHKFIRENGETV